VCAYVLKRWFASRLPIGSSMMTVISERGFWPDITGALGVNVVERWVLEMRAKKEGVLKDAPLLH
jgi:hypothetical protein